MEESSPCKSHTVISVNNKRVFFSFHHVNMLIESSLSRYNVFSITGQI
jgi:hypothetical protein